MAAKAKVIAMTLLLATLYCQPMLGQVAPATILEIQTENYVSYVNDVFDLSRLATDPNRTTPPEVRTFSTLVGVADIVAVNGRPAKGTWVARVTGVRLRPTLTSGFTIADTSRLVVEDDFIEILQADGTPIGTIMVSALFPGALPPGAPLASANGNGTITGGTGAFLGVRGQMTTAGNALRFASVTEDPSNRRVHGGGRGRWLLHLIPLSRPEIVQTLIGPAVAHSNDFVLVTASRPAVPGEVLSLFATGLGPTRPGVDPGKPFPASPLAAVNSPVEVTVNGRPAEVTAAVGFPGAVDGYQVNFRLPPDTPRGTATVQVSVAWIAGSEVRIVIQ
ncbi:MAG: hypothetical protein HY647_07595 [Acidobacteria bacterium]|nr:hypothetical protein [Acidobacteriota bacterium]